MSFRVTVKKRCENLYIEEMKDILAGGVPVRGVRTLDKNKIGIKLRLGEDWGSI